MFSFNIDLGQLIIALAIAIIGWFVKKTIRDLEDKLTEHDDAIHELSENVNQLIGATRWRRND